MSNSSQPQYWCRRLVNFVDQTLNVPYLTLFVILRKARLIKRENYRIPDTTERCIPWVPKCHQIFTVVTLGFTKIFLVILLVIRKLTRTVFYVFQQLCLWSNIKLSTASSKSCTILRTAYQPWWHSSIHWLWRKNDDILVIHSRYQILWGERGML